MSGFTRQTAYPASKIAAALAWIDCGLPAAALAGLERMPRPALARNRPYPFPPLVRTVRFRDDAADSDSAVDLAIAHLKSGRIAEAAEVLRQLIEPAEYERVSA
jgi:hypothetical protein